MPELVPVTRDSGLARSILSASFVYALGDLLTRGFSAFLVPIYTRYLTPADYGVLSSVTALNIVLAGVIGLSLNGATARFHAEMDDPRERRAFCGTVFCFVIAWGMLVTLALNTVGAPFLDGLFKSVRFDPYLRLGTWIALVGSISLVPLSILQVQNRPLLYRGFTTAAFGLNAGLILFFVVGLRRGAQGSLVASLIAGSVMAVAYLVFMSFHVEWALSRRHLASALSFSLPLVVYSLGGWVTEVADRFFVERYTSLTELGWYNLASQLSAVVFALLNAINMAWLPFFYEIGKRPDAPEVLARYGRLAFAGALGLALPLAVFADEIVSLLASPTFRPAATLVPILAWVGILSATVWWIAAGPLFLAKRTHHLTWMTLVAGAANVGFNLAFTPRYGMIGAAISTVLAYLVLDVMAFATARKVYPIPHPYRSFALALLAAGGVVSAGRAAELAGPLIAFGLKAVLLPTYPVLLIMLRVVKRDELGALENGLRQLLARGPRR